MEPQPPDPQLERVAQVLGQIRDSWVLVSLALKDHLADAPSAAKDEVMTEVARHLSRLSESTRWPLK